MLSRLMKVFLACSSAGACLYGISAFGFSPWPLLILLVALFLGVSAFTPRLDLPARVIGHAIGILSLMALSLLLLAATIGGRFHLSPSNEVIALFLFLMALFGMTSFLWPGAKPQRDTDPETTAPE